MKTLLDLQESLARLVRAGWMAGPISIAPCSKSTTTEEGKKSLRQQNLHTSCRIMAYVLVGRIEDE
ncbi:MAG TPA: hypothetical protein VF590_16830, partial [Isosphaeraceae bacterium]